MELKDKGRQIVLESSAFYPAHSYWIIAPEAHFVLCFLILMLFDFSNFYDSLIYHIYIYQNFALVTNMCLLRICFKVAKRSEIRSDGFDSYPLVPI